MAKQGDLLSVDEARQRILSRFTPLPSEAVDVAESGGRVLATTALASTDVPPFTNSSMDGFAVQSASVANASGSAPIRLQVTSHVAAGTYDTSPVESGGCARIMTGAPLPPGADAVIPFEDVDDDTTSISVFKPVPAWSCVRLRGQDLQQGTPLLAAGTAIGAPQLALLAASGSRSVKVTKQPVIAVFSTGNELMDPGEPLAPGQIYNSNTPMLAQAVREAGGEALTLHTVADDRAAIVHAFQSASGSDLIVTSGGASVGDFDYITDIVRQNGSLNFWKVRVRPGKPLVSGTINGTPVIGLPGNPTSAMVTFELFVRPAIRTMLGAPPLRTEIEAVLDERVDNRGGRRTYVRVRLSYADGHFRARLSGPQDSAMLLPLAHADGLLIAPEDQEELIPGDIVTVLVWRLPSPAHARDIQAS